MDGTITASSLVDWVGATCEANPDALVVSGDGGDLTFSDLWRRSMHLAQDLSSRGVRVEDRVGLWAEQGGEMLVGVVAILAAGAAYVPLDPTYPRSRLEFMATDAKLSLVVAPEEFCTDAQQLGVTVVSTASRASHFESPVVPMVVDDTTAAYVIYTSGSTGRPKGVVIERHSVFDLLVSMIAELGLGPRDSYISTSSSSFDAFVPNVMLPLVTGGTLVAIDPATAKDPYALADAVARYRPSLLQTSPTMLRMLVEIGWPGDRDLTVWTGGEPTAASVIRYIAPRVRTFCNFYGPTETTVQVTMARLSPTDSDAPVGWPREGVRCYLLDETRRPVREGDVGELYITGNALARGYLNAPELTQASFVSIETGAGHLERAYRTGDLARLNPDGSMVVIGRVDDQIKLRGYRIELREIEERLMEHPSVSDAVVVLVGGDDDAAHLAAFYKARENVAPEALRDFAKELLPAYMVPTAYVEIEEFPLTPGGKVDKRHLVDLATLNVPGVHARASTSSVEEQSSELEARVVGWFANVLNLEREALSPDDDFFDLGGTSLASLRLFMLIQQREALTLPLSTLVDAPTARLLARVIADRQRGGWGSSGTAEPPRHEWERALCALWSETLGGREVSRTDDFFELGANTQDAQRMIEQLKNTYATSITLDELRAAPTVAQLAILTSGRSTHSNLVALNRAGSRTPFFCIAGSGGLALNFLPLARLLGPDQPFFGLQAQGIESRALPDFTLSAAALRHVKAIRSVQPHGPYLIGGHSLGGVLALKVAQRLEALGEEVALLAIMDTVLSKRMSGVSVNDSKSAFTRTRQWRLFHDRTKPSIIMRLPLTGIVPQAGLAQFELFGLHDTIEARFARRLSRWSGPTVIFASDDGAKENIELGWSHVLTGPWSKVLVPGDHLSMMQRPNVTVLAQFLGDRIASASKGVGEQP
ncbi:MAG: amino acid adenylation domain-containing protein [Acidimicrobiales bacterium]